jgi:pimeloyl-ACP methyl ester carboxylesterase
MDRFSDDLLTIRRCLSPSSAFTALDQLDAFVTLHGPFDGIIAFSNGAQLAATYIVHKKLKSAASDSPFKCAILFSPLGVYDSMEWIANGRVQKLDVKNNIFAIDIPSLVVWGRNDPGQEDAQDVSLLCDPETSYTFVHSGGHEIPGIGLNEALGPVAKLAKRCIMNSCAEDVQL